MKIENELHEGEQLLWTGSPKPGLLFRPVDLFMIPLSILVLWEGIEILLPVLTVLNRGLDLFAVLSLVKGTIPTLYGLHLLIGRFVIDILHRSNTTYGVTNQRVIILSKFLFTKSVKTIFLSDHLDVSLKERVNGTGTVTFKQLKTDKDPTAKLILFGVPQERTVPTLEVVEHAHQVYDVIVKATQEGMIRSSMQYETEKPGQDQKKALFTSVALHPFKDLTLWIIVPVLLGTVMSSVELPMLDGLRVNIHLLSPILVGLVGYRYGKRAGAMAGVIVFLPGFALHLVGYFTPLVNFEGTFIAGKIETDSFNFRTFGLSYLSLVPLGYLAAKLKERLYSFAEKTQFIGLKKHVYSAHPGIFLPVVFFTFSLYLTSKISLHTNLLFYVAPMLIAYYYGTSKAFRFLVYIAPFFLFNYYFGNSYFGYKLSSGTMTALFFFLITLGMFEVNDREHKIVFPGFLFTAMIFISLLFNLSWTSENLFFTCADFLLPFILLVGLLFGPQRGFWFGVAWGITNIIHYRLSREFAYGAPSLHMLAAPLVGYLGGTGLFSGGKFLRRSAYLVVLFNLLVLLVSFINGSKELLTIKTYYIRGISLAQGLVMVAAIRVVLLLIEKRNGNL